MNDANGITVDTAAGPMEIPWDQVSDYFRIVHGWREVRPKHRWWQRRRT